MSKEKKDMKRGFVKDKEVGKRKRGRSVEEKNRGTSREHQSIKEESKREEP